MNAESKVKEFGQCPDTSTLGPGLRKKNLLKGDKWWTTVTMYHQAGVVVKTEQHPRQKGEKMLNMYRSMLNRHDPTCAMLMGVKIEEFRPAGKNTHLCFEITTWTELVAGDHPTPGCISPGEAATLYEFCLRHGTWFGLHHDLHRGNVQFRRDENGKAEIQVIDFGHHIEAEGCPGDTSAFSMEAKQFVRPSFFVCERCLDLV